MKETTYQNSMRGVITALAIMAGLLFFDTNVYTQSIDLSQTDRRRSTDWKKDNLLNNRNFYDNKFPAMLRDARDNFTLASTGDAENVELVSRWANGPCGAVAVVGNIAYFGNGAYLEIVDFSNSANPIELGKLLFPSFYLIEGLAVSGGFAYVAYGRNGLRVIDVSDPTKPFEVGYFVTVDYAYDVAVSGGFAYVADGWLGLRVIDVSDPTNPFETGYFDTGGNARGVAISGGFAYIADYTAGLRVIDVLDPTNPFETGYFDTGGNTEDVAVSGGFAYVADYIAGLRVIDVSDPANPFETGYFGTGYYACDVAVSGGYAYVADYYAGLRVIDVSDPSHPFEAGYFGTAYYAYGIAVNGGYAYVANFGAGLRVINVSNPTSPVETGHFDTAGALASVAVSGGFAYLVDEGNGLRVIDVSDPTNPFQAGYFHIGGNSKGVAVSGTYAYVTDGNYGLHVIDVSDPTKPFKTGYFNTPGYALGVALSGDFAYVADGGTGLRVIDVSDPTHPFELGYFDTGGSAKCVTVSGSYAYVADEGNGLRVIDITDPTNPFETGYFDTGGLAWSVAVSGSYAYVADELAGLRVINVSDPYKPIETGYFDTDYYAYGVAVSGDYVYVADFADGLRVIDVSDPTNPVETGHFDTEGAAKSVTVSGGYAYVPCVWGGLYILRFKMVTTVTIPPGNPSPISIENTQVTLDYDSGPGGEVTVQEIKDYPPKPQISKVINANFTQSNDSDTLIAAKRYWEITTDMATGSYTTILKIAYDVNDFPSGLSEENANILYFDQNLNEYVALATFRDTANDTLWTENYLDHLGRFALGKLSPSTVTQIIPIAHGRLNMISFNILPSELDISKMLDDLQTLLVAQDDDGKFYIPPYGVNTIGNTDLSNGYQIYITGSADDQVMNDGDPLVPQEYSQALNNTRLFMIGYPYQNAHPVTDVFASITSAVVVVQDDAGRFWIPMYGVNTMGDMRPGKGYQIYASQTVNFTYPALLGGLAKATESLAELPAPSHFQLQRTGLPYGIVVTGSEQVLTIGDEVGVFAGELCVGAAVFTGAYPLVIAAWEGNEEYDLTGFKPGEVITLRVWKDSDGQEVEVAGRFATSSESTFQGGPISVVSIEAFVSPAVIPTTFGLDQNYPNPFNAQTEIKYQIPKSGKVILKIYNTLGQEIRTLVDEEKKAGYSRVIWDGKTDNGLVVTSGIYIYRIQAGDFRRVKKMLFLM